MAVDLRASVLGLVAAGLGLMVCGCESAPSAEARVAGQPGPDVVWEAEATRQVRRLAAALREVDMAELVADWERHAEPPAGLERVIGHPIPQRSDIAADYPRYWLVADPAGDRMWVRVAGDFMGNVEWRGPVEVEAVPGMPGDGV